MRTLRTLYPGGLSIESDYCQSFQTNAYFYCNVWLSQFQGTSLSNCYCIFLSFVYLAALVQDTFLVLLIDFSSVLSVEFRSPASVLDGTLSENIWQFTFCLLSKGVTFYVLLLFPISSLISIQCVLRQLGTKSKTRAT